ncbi:MAG: NADH-quinone oxidoreductase subunit C [Candidatus Kapabacteria bacterium]|nr:NADH-quinone oxidoreductase subunit C [Candidatus Kapabacteria bacterium]
MALTHNDIIQVAKAVAADVQVVEHHGDLTLAVKAGDLLDVLHELKDNPTTAFNQLVDITAIDWARPGDRYEVVYFLASFANATRVRVKVGVREDAPHVPTSIDVWESANWYERETYDMYGIIFDGHPDLRRFYMPEDFMDASGTPLYPLRKDFPLMGIPGSLPLPAKD